jgi:hypothetical protein
LLLRKTVGGSAWKNELISLSLLVTQTVGGQECKVGGGGFMFELKCSLWVQKFLKA